MPFTPNAAGLPLETVDDREAHAESYTKIPIVEEIPDYFARIGHTDAANMLNQVIEKGRDLRHRGIRIAHKVYFSGDDLQDFLNGKFSYTTANLLQTLEHLETALGQYLHENEAIHPTVETALFWGESQYERDYFQKKDRLSLHGGMTETGVHERLMRVIIKRTANGFRDATIELGTHLNTIVEAAQLAQAELGLAHEVKVVPEVMAAMAELQTAEFDGQKSIIRIEIDEGNKVAIAGVPSIVNCYHATLADTTLYSMVVWGEFISQPELFLRRCLAEIHVLDASITAEQTLLYQFMLNLKRIRAALGHVSIHFLFAGQEVMANDLLDAMLQVPHTERHSARAFAEKCQELLFASEQKERASRSESQYFLQLLAESDGTADTAEREAKLRHEAVDISINMGGSALIFSPEEAIEIEERKSHFAFGNVQKLEEIMPPVYWRAIEEQAQGNSDRIDELAAMIERLNQQFHVELTIKYLGEAEATERIAEKRILPREHILLRVFGTIAEAIETLENLRDVLTFYNQESGNPLAGQRIEMQWFDQHDPDELKYDTRRKRTTSGTDKPLIHHQCGHILDMLEGNTWETDWYERDFDHSLCTKRAIDARVAISHELSSLDFQHKDETIIQDMRSSWFDRQINYRFQGNEQSIRIAEFMNRNGVYRGSPTQFSLTSGAEERAEIWMMFTSNPTEFGELDMEGQTRLVVMAKDLIARGVLSKEWFIQKSEHFEGLL